MTIEQEKAAKRLAAQKYLSEYDAFEKNRFKAVIGAFTGAVAIAIPWTILYFTGYISMWLGFVMVLFASKGYDSFKGKIDKTKLVAVIIATAFGIILATFSGDILTVTFDSELQSARLEHGLTALEVYFYNFGLFFKNGFVNFVIGCIFAAPAIIKLFLDIDKEAARINELRKIAEEE